MTNLLLRILPALVALCLAACSDAPDKPQRKQQMVKLLPDTPPPPPPPPKPEDRPPKPEDRPRPQEAPKAAEVPQAQALKTDEAAGDGPGSGLAAGPVTQDYTDQKLGQGQILGDKPAENPAQRLALNSYANAATRSLNEYLSRDRDIKRLDYKVGVELWLGPNGSMQRAQLVGSTGDAQTDQSLREALERFPGTGSSPPPRLPQPLRLLVSNRMLG